MIRFRFEDCRETGYSFSIENKVVLLADSTLSSRKHGQLFFCMGGTGAGSGTRQGDVFLVSLSNGERCRCSRGYSSSPGDQRNRVSDFDKQEKAAF